MKKQRVLVLLDPEFLPPEDTSGYTEQELYHYKTESDVIATLRANGHQVQPLPVRDELQKIREGIEEWKPTIVFNLMEEFHGNTTYDQNVASYLQLLRVPFTGCGPRGMVLARGKDLSKKILNYHRVPVPAFAVFPVGRKVRRPRHLAFPLIVKSASEDASLGISQASVVYDDAELAKRIAFIHHKIGPAIAEQYIPGRELYVGLLGNDRRTALPVWELEFSNLAAGALPIATERVKHNVKYQEERGILQGPAENLAPEIAGRIQALAKRIGRILELDGYARVDFRLSDDGTPFFLEANPNPEIASSQEFAEAADFAGIRYGKLLDRILALGLERARRAEDPEA